MSGAPSRVACVLAVAALAAWPAARPARGDHHVEPETPEPAAAATFEDPGHALDAFYAALGATEDGRASHAVRISYLGDSVTADDHIEVGLRRVLGGRFGDGGPGFVHVVPPRGCAHRGVRRAASGGWRIHGVAGPWSADHLLGFGGGSAESAGAAHARITPLSPVVTHAEVFYLAQPHGGDLTVSVDDREELTVSTAAAVKDAGFATVPVTGTLKSIELDATSRVRVFGVVLEADTGVVVDNLGVTNATARHWAATPPAHWGAEIAHRAPDLIVVMIGANEAGWLSGRALAAYPRVMARLLAPLRAARPDASCLVVSPFDQLDFEAPGLPPRASIEPMVAAQRQAALAAGCAFWDAHAWMGGVGSSRDWYRRGWMLNDFTHPTVAGSRRIADALAGGLLDGYAQYRAR